MKAQELRIGNWIEGALGEIAQVTQLGHKENSLYIEARGNGFHGQNGFEPIPLTEEWLVNFGAEMFEFDNGQPNQYRIGTELYVIRDGVIIDYGTSVKLPFVHTFQNLYFAKKGEELTLNPQ